MSYLNEKPSLNEPEKSIRALIRSNFSIAPSCDWDILYPALCKAKLFSHFMHAAECESFETPKLPAEFLIRRIMQKKRFLAIARTGAIVQSMLRSKGIESRQNVELDDYASGIAIPSSAYQFALLLLTTFDNSESRYANLTGDKISLQDYADLQCFIEKNRGSIDWVLIFRLHCKLIFLCTFHFGRNIEHSPRLQEPQRKLAQQSTRHFAYTRTRRNRLPSSNRLHCLPQQQNHSSWKYVGKALDSSNLRQETVDA